MTALQTAADVNLELIYVLVLCGIFFLVNFFRGSIFFEKLADFCLFIILIATAAWIWFDKLAIVINVAGINYKNIPETVFYYAILSSFVLFVIAEIILATPKLFERKKKAPKEKE